MKKILFMAIMFGLFLLFPVRPMALLEVDENGNAVSKEVKEGEVTIMMEPAIGDQTVSAAARDNVKAGETTPAAPDGNATSRQVINNDENRILPGEDIDYQVTSDDTFTATSAEGALSTTSVESNSNIVPIATISGMSGITLGAVAIFLVKKKKGYEHAL